LDLDLLNERYGLNNPSYQNYNCKVQQKQMLPLSIITHFLRLIYPFGPEGNLLKCAKKYSFRFPSKFIGHENVAPKQGKFGIILIALIAGNRRLI